MKKIIWIATGCYFIDSLIYFQEKGFKLYVLKLERKHGWKKNYHIFEQMGAEFLSDVQEVFPLLDSETLVIGGGNFAGKVPSFVNEDIAETGIEELETLFQISLYNKKNHCGAKCLRYFNGDTGFGSQQIADFFNQKIQFLDALMFDNTAIQSFVLLHIPNARKIKNLIGWLETPLKRFVQHNTGPIEHRFISLGRCISAFNVIEKNKDKLPITFYPIRTKSHCIKKIIYKFSPKPSKYSLAGLTDNFHKIYSDRKRFTKWESPCAFGLSHMYDIFQNSVSRFKTNKDFYLSLDGQKEANSAGAPKEMYYAFINTPNKEACYMMFGIIPLISHTENEYYKSLVDKKMAILIQKQDDIKSVLDMSDREIQQYRDNIYDNMDMFTFDHVGEMLIKLLD